MARVALFLAVAVCMAALGACADAHAWDDDPHPVTLRDSDVFANGYTASDAENFFNVLMVVPLDDGMLVLYSHGGFVRAGIAPAAQPDALVLRGDQNRFLYTCASGVAVGSADMDTTTPQLVLEHALDGSASATFVRDSATDSSAYVLVGDGDALVLWKLDVDDPTNNEQVSSEPLPSAARFGSVLLDDRLLWVNTLPASDGLYNVFVYGVDVDTGKALDAVPLVSDDRTTYSGVGAAAAIGSEAYVTLTYPCQCLGGRECQCSDAFEWTGARVTALWNGVNGHAMMETNAPILDYDDQDVVFINEDSADIPVVSIVPLLKTDNAEAGKYLTFYGGDDNTPVTLSDVRGLYIFDADTFVFSYSTPENDNWLLGVLDRNYDVKPSPLAPQCSASISTVRGEEVFFVCPRTYPSTVFRYNTHTLDVANVTAVHDGLAITGLNWVGHVLAISTSDGALFTTHLASKAPTPPNEQHMRNGDGGGKNIGVIVGVSVGVTLLALLVVTGILAARRRRGALATGMSGTGASAPLYQNGAVPAQQPYGAVHAQAAPYQHQAAPYQHQASPYQHQAAQPPQLPGDRSYARNVVV